MTLAYTIWPLRFSPQPEKMIDFFAALGLSKTFDHDQNTFAVFAGRSGTLGVHSSLDTASGSIAGHTALNFSTADLESAATELKASGVDAQVWDEAYGKQGSATDPAGQVIGLNEETQADLYGGYRTFEPGHGETVAASMDVMAVCFVDDLPAAARYFAAFGFVPDTELSADSPWATLRSGPANGLIGLHSIAAADAPPPSGAGLRPDGDPYGPPVAVALSFTTSEPLDALASRLQAAGYSARTVEQRGSVRVDVDDPDGETIQIHPST